MSRVVLRHEEGFEAKMLAKMRAMLDNERYSPRAADAYLHLLRRLVRPAKLADVFGSKTGREPHTSHRVGLGPDEPNLKG